MSKTANILNLIIYDDADVNRVSGFCHKTPKEAHKDQGVRRMWGELFR